MPPFQSQIRGFPGLGDIYLATPVIQLTCFIECKQLCEADLMTTL